MSDKIIPLAKPKPVITADRRPVDMSIVDDMTLLVIFVDAINEMKERIHYMKDMRVSDANSAPGQKYDMLTIMRRMQQQLNYITIACGRG